MDNTIMYFLIGILVAGMLSFSYFTKGSGGLMVIAIILGILLMLVLFFGGAFGPTPR